jgi:hypothetical protein
VARSLSREEARAIGRIGGLRLASTHDPRTYTEAARAAFLAGDHSQCHVCLCPPPIPDTVPPDERARRLEARMREHMARLAYRSARARGGAA